MENLQRVVNSFGPILYVRNSEEHEPTSIDWYVNRCRLSNESTKLFTTNVTLDDLPVEGGSEQCHLELKNKSDRRGDLSRAKAYIKVQEVGQYVEVQFWFFYGYSSPIKAKITNVTASKKSIEIPLLEGMEGRWHSVSICFADADMTTPLYVRTKNEMRKFVDCHNRDGDKVRVYSSATFGVSFDLEHKPVSMHRNIIGDQIRVEFIKETGAQKKQSSDPVTVEALDCSNRYEIIDATFLGEGTPAVPSWTKFGGRLGSGGDNNSVGSTSNLPLSTKGIRKTVQRYVNPWPEILPRVIKPASGDMGSKNPFGHRITMTKIADRLVSIVEESNQDPHAPISVQYVGVAA